MLVPCTCGRLYVSSNSYSIDSKQSTTPKYLYMQYLVMHVTFGVVSPSPRIWVFIYSSHAALPSLKVLAEISAGGQQCFSSATVNVINTADSTSQHRHLLLHTAGHLHASQTSFPKSPSSVEWVQSKSYVVTCTNEEDDGETDTEPCTYYC